MGVDRKKCKNSRKRRGVRPRARKAAPPADALQTVLRALEESARTKMELSMEEAGKLALAGGIIADALRAGRKAVFFGNGGSAADAQHLAAELVGKFQLERRALPALALSVNTSALTAIANDSDYKYVFSRQIEALVGEGDVAVALSTSGRSPSVLEGIRAARERGARTIGLTGLAGEPMRRECELCITVPSLKTPRIQEVHITLGHILCELVERELFGERARAPPARAGAKVGRAARR
ncbi:MAG: D-sedoheptulose 7-phosphate isomerase [Thermoplasmata archaeon]